MKRGRSLAGMFGALLLMAGFLGMPEQAAAELLTIYHTNDMHARVVSTDDREHSIGLAEMAAVVKSEKAVHPDTLWLDAGDTFHGMPRINISRGESMAELLNQAGVDAMVPGNHDYNYGSKRLEELAERLNFPVLSANTVRKGTHEKVFRDYRIYEMPDGIKVGVFGLTTPETAYKTDPSNVTAIEFLDPVTEARLMVWKLRSKCDVLVALVHMGLDKSSEFTSEQIAREVSGIDLIVDGHSHTKLPEGLRVNDTLIVQTGWHEYNLGKVVIDVENHQIESMQAELLSKEKVRDMGKGSDPLVKKTLEKIDRKNDTLFRQVVAHADRALTSDRLIVRRQEAELGNLCADALRWRTGADIAVVNGGSLRSDLPAGNVTRGDIMAIFPFGNTIKMAEIKGSAVREMLEHSVFGYPESFGGFLDVSGMSFAFDPAQPVGSRVSDILIQGQPLEEERTYRLASNDYLLAGGDAYDMLAGLAIVGEFDTCEGTLADYLNEVGMPDIGTGRITCKAVLQPSASEPEEGGVKAEVPEKKTA